MTKFTKTLIATALSLTAAGANAAAFQLAEVSTSGLGMAYAGNAAVADNASVVVNNPALMTKFKQTEISVGGILVDADVNVSGTLNGVADASQKNIVPNAVVPNAYIVSPINDRFSVGGGINVNYGMKSEFNPTYSAGFFGGRTDLTAINANLGGAVKLGYGFSLGLGLNAVHAKAVLERYAGAAVARVKSALAANQTAINTAITGLQNAENAVAAGLLPQAAYQLILDNVNNQLSALGIQQKISNSSQLSSFVAAVNSLQPTQTIHRLKGDKWGFGWNAGLVYELNDDHRFGVSYTSAVNIKFKGQYSNNVTAPIPGVVDTLTGGASIPGSLTLNLPAFWEVAGYHRLTEKLAMQYSFKKTLWNKFTRLQAVGASGNELFSKDEYFNNATRTALGFSYDVTDALTLRTGVAFDETASIAHPSISIPDTDRTWYSLGATYRFTPNLSADIGYSHLRGSKNSFTESQGAASGAFKVSARANLYGLNVNYKF